MSYPINFKNIHPEVDFYSELDAAHRKAEDYLLGFKWCAEIKDCFLYYNLGEIFSIFLFEIENTQSAGDRFLWIIVGDIPSMYLDIYGTKSTVEVVEDYIKLAADWIVNVRARKSVEDCYPFDAEPKIELANLLAKRIAFMKDALLNNMDEVALHINA
ncbi:hypothetical protein [Mucilaginibacter sp. FT3.2]|uniref:hypothetical protein n=1 Tax=Mucilaginibacter sp. FT3.2 TaxID=2723090 RepID=UPI00160B96CB|nr:hypothetical protein [Mucilaginibacter sp. FT3.2]MBB6231748.1 hypothetical protein [Mucilaginibacter sp. FT3.2]